MSNITIIKSKLNRSLALTQQESWELYKYIKVLEQEPKTGHWINGGFDFNYWICSKCKYQPNNDYCKPSYNYCPNCGVKMEVEK